MSDFWVSRYAMTLVKEIHPPLIFNIEIQNTFDKEEVLYFFRITNSDDEGRDSGLTSGQAKIFVIKSGQEFIYVGYASESIYNRLSKSYQNRLAKLTSRREKTNHKNWS
jgi:hypothetical protein